MLRIVHVRMQWTIANDVGFSAHVFVPVVSYCYKSCLLELSVQYKDVGVVGMYLNFFTVLYF